MALDDIDIFDENGALTAEYLLSRGYCCANGCRNCPYEPRHGGLDAVPRRSPDVQARRPGAPDAASDGDGINPT